MRYLLYARKSSESEDKQAQSIDDQLKDLRLLARQRALTIVGELTESKSAKAPGARPVFAELVARLDAGQADAILCWHVNRLFRNPVDFGTLSWMLQTGTLQEIHTPHQVHRCGDNVLLLSVENGMANQYILDLRKAVQRGLNSKIAKGWFPHKAPEGYLNQDGIIVPDPDRFPRIRRVFELALAGEHSVPQILAELRRWGYTTKKLKRTGGGPISRSALYSILSNLFYAGYFVRAGETFQGAHEPLVTLAEFFRVQRFLKRYHRRHRRHAFAFSGLMRCGRCGAAVVGEIKRRARRDGSWQHYTYYSCSNARGACPRKVIREEAVAAQIGRVLDTLSVPEDFVAFAQQVIARWKEETLAAQQQVKQQQAQTLAALEAKQTRLLDLKLNDLLTDSEFREQKGRLHDEVRNARMAQQGEHAVTDALWENIENAAALLHYGRALFEGGTPAMQHRIARTLGATFILTDGSLAIELSPVFSHLCEQKKSLEIGSAGPHGDDSSAGCPVWWSMLDAIRTGLLASETFVPNLKAILVPEGGIK